MPASTLATRHEPDRLARGGKRLSVGTMKAEQLGKPLGRKPCRGPIMKQTVQGGSVQSAKRATIDLAQSRAGERGAMGRPRLLGAGGETHAWPTFISLVLDGWRSTRHLAAWERQPHSGCGSSRQSTDHADHRGLCRPAGGFLGHGRDGTCRAGGIVAALSETGIQ